MVFLLCGEVQQGTLTNAEIVAAMTARMSRDRTVNVIIALLWITRLPPQDGPECDQPTSGQQLISLRSWGCGHDPENGLGGNRRALRDVGTAAAVTSLAVVSSGC
jgi:hypothetical protein